MRDRQVRLAARPTGLPGPECWEVTTEDVPALSPGEVHVDGGLEAFPEAFLRLFRGQSTGKLVLRVAG